MESSKEKVSIEGKPMQAPWSIFLIPNDKPSLSRGGRGERGPLALQNNLILYECQNNNDSNKDSKTLPSKLSAVLTACLARGSRCGSWRGTGTARGTERAKAQPAPFMCGTLGRGPKRATGQRLTSGSFQVNAVREAKSLAECDK